MPRQKKVIVEFDGDEVDLPLADLNEALAGLTYDQLEGRKRFVVERLDVIGIEPKKSKKGKDGGVKKKATAPSKRRGRATNSSSKPDITTATAATNTDEQKQQQEQPQQDKPRQVVAYEPKSDVHWDFAMKEMMWLAADFTAERKRQKTLGKKIAGGLNQHFKTKETRRIRALAEAELKRRRLAGRIGREVKGWWTKIERVIAYKQKMEADTERQKAMNRQLASLVQQTERYGQTLSSQIRNEDFDDDEAFNDSLAPGTVGRRRKRKTSKLTIEEALAAAEKKGRRKTTLKDYSLLELDAADKELYGESTEESGSDGSFVLDRDSEDDETTLMEAEQEETRSRRLRRHRSSPKEAADQDDNPYVPDPEEIRKLKEEGEMEIEALLERLREETSAPDGADPMDIDYDDGYTEETAPKKAVSFADQQPITTGAFKADPGNDADDDADASDVEDFEDTSGGQRQSGDDDDEFIGDANVVDDETTIEAEERLGREMSAQDEIDMLEREGSMPIEELRRIYAAMENSAGDNSEPAAGVASRTNGVSPYNEDVFNVDDARDEDEFQPRNEVDDETTIEAEERLGREISAEEEISLLQRESEIPIEELRAMHAAIHAGPDDEQQQEQDDGERNAAIQQDAVVNNYLSNGASDDLENQEFVPDALPEVDDETTIEAEERLGREMSYQDELALLQQENEIPIEELRNRYAQMEASGDNDERDSVDFFGQQGESDDGSEEVIGDVDVVDDETTIAAEERLGREMSVEDEIALLKQESEVPLEELRQQLQLMEGNTTEPNERTKRKRHRDRKADPPAKKLKVGTSSVSTSEDEGLKALKALREAEERARATRATRPFLLSNWVKLREYQQIGLNWLVSIQNRRLNGILADEMGLGKTLQTISLLSYLAAYNGIWGPHLVVVPTSCIVNWETELKRFCPALKVLCYYGTAKRRKELRTGWTKVNWYHVVITSYQLVVQDSFAFKRKKWYYMILDEAHNIKNFQSQRWQTLINFNTQRRLLLTGTPLQNNLTELWSLLHFLMPHVFRSRKEFAYWFSNPMNNIIEGNTKRSNELISRLHGIIRPFVLRRLKKDVEQQMPGKFEHIVKCPMSRRQMFLYEEFMARSSTRQALKQGGNFMGMMNVLMQLRKVCNHPDLFEPRSVITPLVIERIDYKVPTCVMDLVTSSVPRCSSELSSALIHPLWTGSRGDPAPEDATEHDNILRSQYRNLEVDRKSFVSKFAEALSDEPKPTADMNEGLAKLLTKIREEDQARREETKERQSFSNLQRCRFNVFAYSGRVLKAVLLDTFPLDRSEPEIVDHRSIISTPADLLAMRRSQMERADDLDGLVKKFVFCIPKAESTRPRLDCGRIDRRGESFETNLTKMLLEPVEEVLKPYRRAKARLSSFFPDKKLVQFDAGKLQTLSVLLRDLKQGGHRALIFTQMSKMLDVLEAFLNMNGHTYLRLDGGTGVDRRQRLMDRFNMDEKIFCFILSTRSGGLGINLTGADTVVFYDSDWNPAMDAQAQDRAHRIGQTRDVHIYRLITEHSIEENIWTKAKQKRNLDAIVMDEGKFDAGEPSKSKENESGDVQSFYSKGGLREILGESEVGGNNGPMSVDEGSPSQEEMEKTMAALEDEDDVAAMRGAQQEAAEDLKEFDESVEMKKETDGDSGDNKSGQESQPTTADEQSASDVDKPTNDDSKKQEDDMVKEFENWQSTMGMDAAAIESSLGPTEKYGLNFRENVDPFWSVFAVMEAQRKMEAIEDAEEEIDVDEVERIKAEGEQQAIDDGDLLGTRPPPEDLPRQRHLYQREKSRLLSSKKLRKLTGENWVSKIDGLTQLTFWHNEDTGESRWDKPKILIELEADALAREKKWNAAPTKLLVRIMQCLVSHPERTACSVVCKQWNIAARDISFVRHVLPAEYGAMTKDKPMLHNHFRSLAEAMEFCHPGDILELGDGHYWVDDPGIKVDFPLKFVGDENDPSHVVIELSGTMSWNAKGGLIEGITFRRPRLAGARTIPELLRVDGRVEIVHSVFNNDGSKEPSAHAVGPGNKGTWFDLEIAGSDGPGFVIDQKADVLLRECRVKRNGGDAVVCKGGSHFKMVKSHLEGNGGFGVRLSESSKGEMTKCVLSENRGGILAKESGSSCTPCTGNIVRSTMSTLKTPPGFKLIKEAEDA